MEEFAEAFLAASGIAPGCVAGKHGHGATLGLHPPGTVRAEAGMNAIGESQHDAGLKNPKGQEYLPEQTALHNVTFAAKA